MNINLQIKKNASKLFCVAVIGIFSALSLFAQGNEKVKKGDFKGTHFPTVVLTGKQAGQVIFCVSSNENQAASYRLKVWQLMQGQNGTQAMRSNQPIVTKDVDNVSDAVTTAKHAIKTKGAGGDRIGAGDNSEAFQACSEALQPVEPSAGAKRLKTKTKSNQCNDRQAGTEPCIASIVVDKFPACDSKSSCDYLFTVEALKSDGNPLNPNPTMQFFRSSKKGYEMYNALASDQ